VSDRQYMLDTNIVSHMIRFPEGTVVRRLGTAGINTVCTSALVASELRYGAVKRASARLSALVENLLGRLDILPYEASASLSYAVIRHDLAVAGKLIGPVDLFIAAHAMSLDMTLVTDNVREFSRIDGLKIENWLEETSP
jgi:tRNA(fMet)-specific endonuclease VapC